VETTTAAGPHTPTATDRARPEGRLRLLEAALDYIETRHWDVVLGTGVRRENGVWSCSCGDRRCAQVGAHPAMRDWQKRTSGQPSRAHEWWTAHPQGSIILPTGRAFDVLECSEDAGLLALARLERSGADPGPVAATPTRRLYFFVLPNSRTKVAKILAGLGWGRTVLDLACRSVGDYIVAPPSRMGAHGRVQWVRGPAESARWLPEPEEVLAPLAYACGLHRDR
jgi:Bifunctional DNA primase/polymerase, N-terminal